jgi:hypothetical protein
MTVRYHIGGADTRTYQMEFDHKESVERVKDKIAQKFCIPETKCIHPIAIAGTGFFHGVLEKYLNGRCFIIEFATQVKVATKPNVSRRSYRSQTKRKCDSSESETSNFDSDTEEDLFNVQQVSPERKVAASAAGRIQSCESHLCELCTQDQQPI